MCQKLLRDARLPLALLEIDEELARRAREEGCPCGGALHVSDFTRRPRGVVVQGLPWKFRRRFSFCCAEEGCRQRATPPSVRFMGRRHYLGVMVAFLTAMCHGVTERRARVLCRELGPCRRTLERWRRWWRKTFTATAFWKSAKARFMPPVDEAALPASFVARFPGGDPLQQAVAVATFVAPLSTA